YPLLCSAVAGLCAAGRGSEGAATGGTEASYGKQSVPSSAALAMSGFFAGLTFCLELPALAFLAGLGAVCLLLAPRRPLLAFVPAAVLPLAGKVATNYVALGELMPAYAKVEGPWYQYEGSHWAKKGADRRGVDFAGDQESRPTYAFHLLAGHYGLF